MERCIEHGNSCSGQNVRSLSEYSASQLFMGAPIRIIRTDRIVSFLRLSLKKKYRSLGTVRRSEIIFILMMRSKLFEGSSPTALQGYLTLRAATALVSGK